MMKRTSLGDVECPVARALDEIGDWWSLLIIRDAFDGIRRFTEFQKSLGISKGILTARLKHLVSIDVLETAPISDEGGYQEYVLTRKGRDLFLVTVSLRQWAEDHCFGKAERHSILTEKASGKRVPRLSLQGRDGKELDASMTFVRKAVDLDAPRKVGARRAAQR
ncbi:transcriptional regulator [Bradyrhizobium brasilense]|nr:transcriptional regulator [Bradyrhizobium brasilense]